MIEPFEGIIVIINLHRSIFVKDPCKKCLVSACCRNMCNDKYDFREAFYPYGNRLPALIMLLTCYIAFSAIIIASVKIYNNVAP